MLVCLNPCFNGRYSQSGMDPYSTGSRMEVLILVLMEDTLRVLAISAGGQAIGQS